MTPTTFKELALATPIQRALAEQNYVTPSPIQAQSIPILLKGRDLLGIAQTGTGKTAAFSLPILNALHENPRRPQRKTARVLVLTPTRELATQISQSFDSYGRNMRFRKTLIFGGVGKNPQINAMKPGVDVLVACPGRLLDHSPATQKAISLLLGDPSSNYQGPRSPDPREPSLRLHRAGKNNG